MSWAAKMKEMGPTSLLFLSTDGASVNFIVVADPVLIIGKYKSKTNERVGCPVVTDDGFVLFICGKRVARKLATLESKFKDHVISITRHGIEGDSDTTYEVTAIPDANRFKSLKALAAKTFNAEALQDAIKDATEVTDK